MSKSKGRKSVGKYNPNKPLDSQPTAVRVKKGKEEEAKVYDCLLEHGLKLEEANQHDDCVGKTDAFWLTASGKRHRVAIKIRESKEDILVAVRDPYYGPDDPRTVIGRDMKYEYKFYVTRSPDKTLLRVANGARVHEIVNDMLDELIEKKWAIQRYIPMKSEKHPGCELRLHEDSWSKKPKILAFIKPSYLRTGKEIKYYPYFE